MTQTQAKTRTREAVAVFDDQNQLDKAVDELKIKNFPRHAISVLGSKHEIEKKFGEGAVDPEWLADNPYAPRTVSVRPEEKTIGAAVLVGVPAYLCGCAFMVIASPASTPVLLGAVAIGSIVGASLGGIALHFTKRKLHKNIQRQIKKGGLLLWVDTPQPEKEQQAMDILRKCGGRDIHIHSIA